MIVMPFMKATYASAIVLENPIGILNAEMASRSLPFMLMLDAGDQVSCDDMLQIQ